MANKKGLVKDLESLGFGIEEKTEGVINAFRKRYCYCFKEEEGKEELWTINNELIIRSEVYGFVMKPTGVNKIVFKPI